MAAHPLRAAPTARLRLALDRLEHAGERPRIVAGPRHDLCAKQIRLSLEVAAVSQEQGAQSELAALCDCRSGCATDDRAAHDAGDLTQLQPRILRLGRVGCSMSKQHMGELVRHDTDDLAFGRRGVEHATVHEHRSTGERKRIDLFHVHRCKRILVDRFVELGRRDRDKAIAESREIADDALVFDDGILLANLGRGLATELDVLLGRVSVFRRLHDGLREQTRHGNGQRQHDNRRTLLHHAGDFKAFSASV